MTLSQPIQNIIELPLVNSDKKFIIDTDKKELVLSHNSKWYITGRGYILCVSSITKKTLHLSALILSKTSSNSSSLIDHKNRDKLDNRLANLRFCNDSQSNCNRGKPKNSSSKYKGVSRSGKKWRVSIMAQRKAHIGGSFSSELDAAKRANELMIKYHGEFACLNIIPE